MNEEHLDSIWTEMEQLQSPTTLSRLLDAKWPGRLEAVLVRPDGLPAIKLEMTESVSIDTDSIQQSEYVELTIDGDSTGITMLQVGLLDIEFRDVFLSLATDLSTRVLAASTEELGAQALVQNLARWLRMMKRRRFTHLSREEQIGLFGELTVLEELMAPELGWDKAVNAWTGPESELQDFQFDGIAVEVKTLSASKPQTLTINNERQLDDTGFGLLAIAHLAVNIQKDAGLTLPSLIERMRTEMGGGAAREHFDGLLAEVGYIDFHAPLYESTGYTQRSMDFYKVTSAFPRIIESDLPAGIGRVKYSLDSSAAMPHSIDQDRLRLLLNEPPKAEAQIPEDENTLVEFKQTAWKSVDPGKENVPDKVMNEAVIKTVAGFLNADGGELIIGVEDRSRSVTGIEVDLDHLKADRDSYENKLSTLLRTHLSSTAVSNTRITFVEHDAGTTCHVGVRPASRQVWATSPNKKGEDFFWVRDGNSTQSLKGEAAVNYIREHFG